MVCKDKGGGLHASDIVNFTTGIPAMPAPLPAAVLIAVLDTAIQTDRLNRGMLSIRPSKGMSPHLLMGLSCTVLSMVVLTISSVLVAKKYKASDHSLEKQLQEAGVVIESDITVDTSTFLEMETDDELHMNTFDNVIEEENTKTSQIP